MTRWAMVVLAGLAVAGCKDKGKEASPASSAIAAAPASPSVSVAPSSTSDSAPAGERPVYYERAIVPADLEGRTLRELVIMRNTIFARAGNTFRNPWIAAYFSAQPWYSPLDKMDESKLTPLDRANARAIADYESDIKRDELTRRLAIIQTQVEAGTMTAETEIEIRLLSSRLGRWVGGASVSTAGRTPMEDPSLLDKMITVKQLEKLSRRDLRILRNTVYARRGRAFKSELLDDYFSGMEWYHPDPTFTEDRLSALDKKNIGIIQSVEATLGGPLTDQEHKQGDGWFQGA